MPAILSGSGCSSNSHAVVNPKAGESKWSFQAVPIGHELQVSLLRRSRYDPGGFAHHGLPHPALAPANPTPLHGSMAKIAAESGERKENRPKSDRESKVCISFGLSALMLIPWMDHVEA